ncbi:hypothetical protein I7I50_03557 [Histoplasma capsulatum G186AR]|uniref:Uncharacterized protein n=1 Tax=Ajellomyces capsulatus TaxID=5037 RepID=A0A8H7YL37_AJECA|nr:hypothetical protein I7I52_04464 [Histoplasma capsulatum]QSS74676.1 hypothetical protein I7I50_03557 [Histoplasma capsulatum G186AR]
MHVRRLKLRNLVHDPRAPRVLRLEAKQLVAVRLCRGEVVRCIIVCVGTGAAAVAAVVAGDLPVPLLLLLLLPVPVPLGPGRKVMCAHLLVSALCAQLADHLLHLARREWRVLAEGAGLEALEGADDLAAVQAVGGRGEEGVQGCLAGAFPFLARVVGGGAAAGGGGEGGVGGLFELGDGGG